MDDLISRQAAIDALEKVAELFPWKVPGNRDSYDRYNEAWNDSIGRAEIEIEKLPPAQQWIPCSERLPRQGQEVICQCRANMIKVLKLDADGDWYQDAEHCYMSGFVIAWMPLPEPWKGEQE